MDPLGVEHTDEEIADLIIVLREFEPVSLCSMKRINPKGTPVGDLEEVSDKRVAQVAAVLRISTKARNISAVPPNRLAMKWGAGGTSIGTGANPRDSKHDHTTVGKWRFDRGSVVEMLRAEGYDLASPVIPERRVIQKDGLFCEEGNIILGDSLKVGDKVDKGDVLGYVATTGYFESADPPHLHFEALKDGALVNPNYYFDDNSNK